ncbi:MAG: hypothetical protein GXY81_03000 [Candidatus Cloacimonetes bacterium]|mgnify:CR=1 FL=1|nr:hypothetical protein [Candidatus Cloacimonadota bacterium]
MKRLYLLFFILTVASLAFAQNTYYWIGNTSENWSTASNWQSGHVPTAYDNAVITSIGTYQPFVYNDAECSNLTLSSSTSIEVNGARTLTVNGDLSTHGDVILRTSSTLIVKGNAIWASNSSLSDSGSTARPICRFYKNLDINYTSNFNTSGSVIFSGTSNSIVTNNSSNVYFGFLTATKTSASGATVTIADGQGFTVRTISVYEGNKLINNSTATIVTNEINDLNTGSSTNYGFQCNHGTIEFSIVGQGELDLRGAGTYFNNLTIDIAGGIIENEQDPPYPVVVKGDFVLLRGLTVSINRLEVGGNWENTSTNTTTYPQKVTFTNKTSTPIVKSNQAFNTLVTDTGTKALSFAPGVDVSCQIYSSISGGVDVYTNATFTVNGFTNPTNRIPGRWYLSHPNGVININNPSTVPFNGWLEISSGVLNLNNLRLGTLSGTTFYMLGGTIHCDGIYLQSTFQPYGGTIVLESTDTSYSMISLPADSWLHNLQVQPDTKTYHLFTDLTLKGSFILNSGEFSVKNPTNNNIHTMYVAENWINNRGPEFFHEEEGTVVFNGPGFQACKTDEVFYTIIVDKTPPGSGGDAFRIESPTTGVYLNVSCQNYKWLAGALDVSRRGTLTINNVLNPTLEGNFWCNEGCQLNINTSNISLNGSMHITGGEINITQVGAGFLYSHMLSGSLEITSGSLNFTNAGMVFPNTNPFSTSISGGTISVVRDFNCLRNDFQPTGGTLLIKGSEDNTISFTQTGSHLYNLTIAKDDPEAIVETWGTTGTDIVCNGNIIVNSGEFRIKGFNFISKGNISVNNSGKLSIFPNGKLKMGNAKSLNINNGGAFKSWSQPNSIVATLTGETSESFFDFNVNSGGTFEAEYTVFEHMGIMGIYFKSGSICNQLSNCSLSTGKPSSSLITFSNTQTLTLNNIDFPRRPSAYQTYRNVRKGTSQGRIILTNFTGNFSGSAYENDPHDTIFWLGPDVDFVVDHIMITQTDGYVCGVRASSVTIKNIGTHDYLGDIRVDFYKDLPTAPAAGTEGTYHGFVTNLAAGKTKFVNPPLMSTDIAGDWTVWARVDTHNDIVETNENNNLSEPQITTWSPLPPVSNLQFLSYDNNNALMKWDYTAPYNCFKIWGNDDPNFPPETTQLNYSLDGPTPGPTYAILVNLRFSKRFFRVTAERDFPDLE